MIEEILEGLVEELSDIEHQRWADWQSYLHSKLVFNPKSCVWELSEDLYRHWDRQINTPYKDLSEREKQEDRKQVYRYLPLLKEKLTALEKQIKEGEQDRIWSYIEDYAERHLSDDAGVYHYPTVIKDLSNIIFETLIKKI